MRRVAAVCLPVGLVAQAAVVVRALVARPVEALALLFLNQLLTGPVLALGYAAAFVLVARTPAGRWATGWLRWPGRTALWSYLGASAAMAAVFWGLGLGLAGGIGAPVAIGIAVLTVLAQAGLSRLWLAAFRFGPLEWAWRCVTYWRWQPLRHRS
jgi:uncharacterized protein